ncbi:MAG: hypothetical protein DMF61_15440 [Blastocatellia bacterium AA13]|nr:MAG: hypothetical protein DMF61_15440 [Blastocatellia bacterium AA13]
MNNSPQSDPSEKFVQPPLSYAREGPALVGVNLAPGEEVRWIWTHYPGGRSVVTGYEIVKPEASESRFDFQNAVKNWLWPKQ